MPVTAKLSKKFYETFGEDVTNELVEWFNSVDATYQTGLREVNEATFARFEAKLGERLAASNAEWRVQWAQLDAKLAAQGNTLRMELAQSLTELKGSLLKWMFGFWTSVVLALLLLAFRT